MRTSTTVLYILMFYIIVSCNKKTSLSGIPEAVQDSFRLRYSLAENIAWESTDNNGFVAVFTSDQHITRVYFDNTGNLNSTETELNSSEIPLVIMETVKSAFGGRKIKKSIKVENSSGESTYILTLKRGKDIREVEFSTIGVIMREK